MILLSDAHLAALATEHNCVLYSTDADFARFASLKWTNPIADGRRLAYVSVPSLLEPLMQIKLVIRFTPFSARQRHRSAATRVIVGARRVRGFHNLGCGFSALRFLRLFVAIHFSPIRRTWQQAST